MKEKILFLIILLCLSAAIIVKANETNLALKKTVEADNTAPGSSTEYAVDGNYETIWNSGKIPEPGMTEKIKIDLLYPQSVKKLKLLTGQESEGVTDHIIYFEDSDGNQRFVTRFNADTRDGQWLEYEREAPYENVRYIYIYTIESPSPAAWREIEVISETEAAISINIALNRPAYSSSWDIEEEAHCIKAIDGDYETAWNIADSNREEEFIKIDLGYACTAEKIRLLIAQDSPGETKHKVYFGNNDENYTDIVEFEEVTTDGQWLEYETEEPVEEVRYILIETDRENSSWIGWKEIEVMGIDDMPVDHLKYFGYYHGAIWGVGNDPEPFDRDSFNYMDEFEDHCNLVAISIDNHDILEYRLEEAKNRNLSVLLCVEHLFYYDLDRGNLDSSKWENTLYLMEKYKDAIAAFYVLDEPFLKAPEHPEIIVDKMNKIAEVIKNDFPEIPITVTFAHPSLFDGGAMDKAGIPQSYDWLSFDYYISFYPEKKSFDEVMKLYNKLLSHMHPGQKIFITGDAVIINPTASPPYIELQYERIIRAREFYNLAKANPDVILYLPFLWPSFNIPERTSENLIGVQGMELLKEEFKRIGTEIKENFMKNR